MASLKCCGVCCGLFSIFAVIFLCVVGAVLNSGSTVINIADNQRSAAASNCFVGAAIYGGFAGLSLLCFVAGTMRSKGQGASGADLRRMQIASSSGDVKYN